MSAKKKTPSKATAKAREELNRVMKATPSCRFCMKLKSEAELTRISGSELAEFLDEMCKPEWFGLRESELSDWTCVRCHTTLMKTYEAAKARAAQSKAQDFENFGIPFAAAIAREAEQASTSRKRTIEQVLTITATDRNAKRTTVVMATDENNKQTTVVVTPAKKRTLPILEDSPTQRLRERQQALRSRMKSREDPPAEKEVNPTVVRTIHTIVNTSVVNPVAVAEGGEAPANPQPLPVRQVVCMDELQVVYNGLLSDKRVPDILTPAPSEEGEPRTPSPCSSVSSGSEQELTMVLKDPSHLCKHCSQMFLTQQQLGWHQRVHTGRGSIRCRLCPRVLPKVSSFLLHQTREHPAIRRPYCVLCNEYVPVAHRPRHEQRHMATRLKYACSFCPLIFFTHKQQKFHRQLFHNDWKLMCRMAPKEEQN